MVGQLTALCFGWPLLPSMVVGTLFSIVYVYVGGFESDVRINVFQFCLMFAGFAVALPVVMSRAGGFRWLAAHVPPAHLTLTGGQDTAFIVVWFFIALWTFVDPGFHQRCYAARSPRVAQTGILIAVLCWAVFDFLTCTTGLSARAIMPGLPAGTHGLAFPLLAEKLLPPGVKGLFYIAMLATVMSTVVSYTFLGAMTIGRDFIFRLRRDEGNERVPAYARFGLVLTAACAIALSVVVPSVVRQWYALGTVMVPGLLLPVLGCYFPSMKVGSGAAVASMVLGSGVALACLLIGWHARGIYAGTPDFPFGLQPMYPGLLASAVAFGIDLLARRRTA
jgi:solute:Na+ symporter, SSS family